MSHCRLVEGRTDDGETGMAKTEFRVLGGAICRVEPNCMETDLGLGHEDTWLLMWLLLEGQVTFLAARDALGVSLPTLRTKVSRLHRKVGLVLPANAMAFELATPVDVDALTFLEVVRGAYQDGRQRNTLLRQARGLRGKGLLPRPEGLPTPAPRIYKELELAFLACEEVGRRLLVIDDRIAEDLAEKLGADHDCETATSFDEFLAFEPRLHEFDLVVVDRHLKPKYMDGQGLDIVKRINASRHAVPVMMMTYRPDGESGFSADEREYGLAVSISKSADGEDAYIGPLAARINHYLREDPVALSCDNIYSGMVQVRRRSEKRLRDRLSGQQLEMELDSLDRTARRVERCTREYDLAGARSEWAYFKSKWDPS